MARISKYLMFRRWVLASLGITILLWEVPQLILTKFQWLKRKRKRKFKLGFMLEIHAQPTIDRPVGGHLDWCSQYVWFGGWHWENSDLWNIPISRLQIVSEQFLEEEECLIITWKKKFGCCFTSTPKFVTFHNFSFSYIILEQMYLLIHRACI